MSYLSRSLSAAESRRLAMALTERAAGEGGGSGIAAITSATDPLQSTRDNALTAHAEQLKHYTGRVYSNLRAIAHRAAAQRIVVAKLHDKPDKKHARYWKGAALSSNGRMMPRKETLPLHLKDAADQLEPLPSHELADLFADPNMLMVGWTLKAITQVHLGLCGKCYWWLVPPTKKPGKPGRNPTAKETDYSATWQIWPMPPSWVEAVHLDGQPFHHWRVRAPNSTKSVDVPLNQILYFYYPAATDPFQATSPLQAQGRVVASHEAMSESQRRSFHRPLPGLMFTIGRHPDAKDVAGDAGRPALTGAQRQQITAWVENMYRGVERYDRPLIIDAIIEKVEKLSQSNREMDYLNSTKIAMQQIDEGFGTNPIVLGRIEGANRASAAAAEDNFCRNTVNPTLTMMSEVLTGWLGPLFAQPGENLVVYVEPAVVTDPDFEVKRAAQALAGSAADLNEYRGMLGLEPREGGERYLVTPQGLLEAFNDAGELEVPEPPPVAEPGDSGGGAPPADDEGDGGKPPKKPAADDGADDGDVEAKK